LPSRFTVALLPLHRHHRRHRHPFTVTIVATVINITVTDITVTTPAFVTPAVF